MLRFQHNVSVFICEEVKLIEEKDVDYAGDDSIPKHVFKRHTDLKVLVIFISRLFLKFLIENNSVGNNLIEQNYLIKNRNKTRNI